MVQDRLLTFESASVRQRLMHNWTYAGNSASVILSNSSPKSKVQTSVLGLGVDFDFLLSQQQQQQEQQEQQEEPPPKSGV